MVLGTVAFLAVPASVTGSLLEDWRRLAGDPAQACFDHERTLLADSAGDRLESYSVVASDANEVTIRYRTRNGAVAVAEAEVVCALREGRFSEDDTVRRREHARVANGLDKLIARFDCLERKKTILRAGKIDEAGRVRCSR